MVTSIQTINKFLRLVQLTIHSRPQSSSFLGHVVGYKLSRVALGTRMLTIWFLEVAYRENPKTNSNSSLFHNYDWILHPRRRQSSH